MFVENQIGSTNPHDNLLPMESANIIKSHVVDGIKLAKKFKIPEIVYQGILEHHGDAVLRFFYEKEKHISLGKKWLFKTNTRRIAYIPLLALL